MIGCGRENSRPELAEHGVHEMAGPYGISVPYHHGWQVSLVEDVSEESVLAMLFSGPIGLHLAEEDHFGELTSLDEKTIKSVRGFRHPIYSVCHDGVV